MNGKPKSSLRNLLDALMLKPRVFYTTANKHTGTGGETKTFIIYFFCLCTETCAVLQQNRGKHPSSQKLKKNKGKTQKISKG